MQTCPGHLWRSPVVPWRHSSGMIVLQCLLSILVASLFCKSSNMRCFDMRPLFLYTGRVSFLSLFYAHFPPFCFACWFFFSFSCCFFPRSDLFMLFPCLPSPFLSSFSFSPPILSLLPLHCISHSPAALKLIGKDEASL